MDGHTSGSMSGHASRSPLSAVVTHYLIDGELLGEDATDCRVSFSTREVTETRDAESLIPYGNNYTVSRIVSSINYKTEA